MGRTASDYGALRLHITTWPEWHHPVWVPVQKRTNPETAASSALVLTVFLLHSRTCRTFATPLHASVTVSGKLFKNKKLRGLFWFLTVTPLHHRSCCIRLLSHRCPWPCKFQFGCNRCHPQWHQLPALLSFTRRLRLAVPLGVCTSTTTAASTITAIEAGAALRLDGADRLGAGEVCRCLGNISCQSNNTCH